MDQNESTEIKKSILKNPDHNKPLLFLVFPASSQTLRHCEDTDTERNKVEVDEAISQAK